MPEVDDEREPDEREPEGDPDPAAARAPSARRTRRARRRAARGTGSAARPRCPAGGSRGSRRAARTRRRRLRRSRGRGARAAVVRRLDGRVTSDDRNEPEQRACAAHLRQPQRGDPRGEDHLRDDAVQREERPGGERHRVADRRLTRPRHALGGDQTDVAHGGVRLSAYTSSERGVAQPGQSAAFGRQKPRVRISPPRLWVLQR